MTTASRSPMQSALLFAATAGLALGAAHCGDNDSTSTKGCPEGGSTSNAGAGGTGAGGASAGGAGGTGGEAGGKTVISSVEDKSVRFATFKADCEERGGYVQTHAVCSGNNACKGVSFNKFDFYLTEHTCSAMNTCGGMSCVVLPEDAGRTPEEMYETSCAGCHGLAENGFVLYMPPGTDLVQALADVQTKDREFIHSAIAFGISSRSSNGVAAANMPPSHKVLSRAEIERVTEYALELPMTAEEYGILGVNEEVTPE